MLAMLLMFNLELTAMASLVSVIAMVVMDDGFMALLVLAKAKYAPANAAVYQQHHKAYQADQFIIHNTFHMLKSWHINI